MHGIVEEQLASVTADVHRMREEFTAEHQETKAAVERQNEEQIAGLQRLQQEEGLFE